MDKNMLIGVGRHTLSVPPLVWKHQSGEGDSQPLAFMNEEHHRVRDFTVLELVRGGKPLSPEQISDRVNLHLPRVQEILAELERHKTFIYRSNGRDVSWAYPVTVEPTPHQVRLSTGEQVFAA